LPCGGSASAQAPVLPAANVEALFNDSNARLNENKQVAYHIERDLLQCKRWNQADRWLTERYIQTIPSSPSGRTAIVQLFGNRPAPETCNDKLDAPIVAVLADGDLVTVVTAASLKDSKGQPYTTTWFDNSTIHQELLPEKRLASKNIVPYYQSLTGDLRYAGDPAADFHRQPHLSEGHPWISPRLEFRMLRSRPGLTHKMSSRLARCVGNTVVKPAAVPDGLFVA